MFNELLFDINQALKNKGHDANPVAHQSGGAPELSVKKFDAAVIKLRAKNAEPGPDVVHGHCPWRPRETTLALQSLCGVGTIPGSAKER